MKRSEGIDRRQLCLGGIAAAGGIGILSKSTFARRRAAPPRTLVVLQLTGGNDGLSTVVPYADDAYHRARGTIRHLEQEVLDLDDYRGLHPALVGLRRHFDEGRLAIIEGAGYPRPDRTHFRSLGVWHAGDRGGLRCEEGWIGRLSEALQAHGRACGEVLHVGGCAPFSMRSAACVPLTLGRNELDRADLRPKEIARIEARLGGDARATQVRARPASSRQRAIDWRVAVDAALRAHRPGIEYPVGAFGEDLRKAAAVVHAQLGFPVVSLELSGFDTHNDQRRRHDRLMRALDGGLGALLDDLRLSEAGRETLVLVFSEFGRRVAENGSLGTDHGAAGPVFVAGHGVRGGVYGRHPSLVELDLGDLVHTTDFRSVYATLIEHGLGIPHTTVLGQRFELLDFV